MNLTNINLFFTDSPTGFEIQTLSSADLQVCQEKTVAQLLELRLWYNYFIKKENYLRFSSKQIGSTKQ